MIIKLFFFYFVKKALSQVQSCEEFYLEVLLQGAHYNFIIVNDSDKSPLQL